MRITVGMPLYKGQNYVAEALRSLQTQTYRDFDVLISVDGGDTASAEACRPFLADNRFRMVVHQERLDWVGNFNWLLKQPIGDFFCYRQHDDLTTPDFFAKLIDAANRRPDAAIVYADCQFFGEDSRVEATPSIEGDTPSRLKQFIQHYAPTACRGIVRRDAVMQAGLVRVDELRSNHQIFVWLAKVLRWGSFLRVPNQFIFAGFTGTTITSKINSGPTTKSLAIGLPCLPAFSKQCFRPAQLLNRGCSFSTSSSIEFAFSAPIKATLLLPMLSNRAVPSY
jgi:glycosyltransferase involved in cell wall biosynthesis